MGDKTELPTGCKMRSHSRYASDEDCDACGEGEGVACAAYEEMSKARRATANRSEGAKVVGIEEELAKGDKVDIHTWLYPTELAVIDAICAKYDCSRSSVIAAWTREYKDLDLAGKVKAGRRPGAGRPPLPKKRKR